MTPDEIYDYPYSLRWAERRLETDPAVRAQDRRLIQAFMKHVAAQGVSTGRRAKYVYVLLRCAQMIRVPFRKAKRRDIEDLIMQLADHEIVTTGPDGTQKRRHYSPETMADFRQMLKRFQKFVRYGDTDKDTPFPDEVKWLRDNVKLSERREPEFFTDEEVEALIRVADTVRDKALIAVAGELGTRVSEVLLVRLGDVRFDDAGAILHIRRGKTGARTLRLISSVAYLADYSFSPTICPRCGEKASPGMLYCPKCATPLERAERAKMAVQEQNTKDELTELRGLLERYLKDPGQKDQPQTSHANGPECTG